MTTPTPVPRPIAPDLRRVGDSTCLACGLLCDDITVVAEGDRIVEAERACDLGRAWFLGDHRHEDQPSATIDRVPAPLDEAIDRAAAILASAKAPFVTGLSGTSVEAQALAIDLSERIGATIDPAHSIGAWSRIGAVQRAGGAFSSFGEVKNRADVILLWRTDPSRSFPRFWERLVDPPGRFVPEGRAGRTLLVIDGGDSEARGRADSALGLRPSLDAEVLRVLRAIVRGIELDGDRVERACRCSLDELRRWADRLMGARYGVLVFDGNDGMEPAAIESMMRLIDDLNRTTRWVTLPLVGGGNPSGAEAVMTSRLGAPLAVDLSDGTPRFLPGDVDIGHRRDGSADVVLDLGGFDTGRNWSGCPIVRIAPDATAEAPRDGVAIACASPGIDTDGTVVRSDEVTIPLRPALDPIRPADREVLAAILDRLPSS